MRFYHKLESSIQRTQSLLCVGLDPVWEKLPTHLLTSTDPLWEFLRPIIEETAPYAAAYKPNFAYFEALGAKGMETLSRVIAWIPKEAVIIGDAKRGDVGHSAEMYAKAVFETFACDAVTVNPYQGWDAVEPFLRYPDKGAFLLCLTSNSGANDFQIPHDLYLEVARKAKAWNTAANCGLVVGATRPERIQTIRECSGPMPYLIPGVGTQGGDLEATLKHVADGTSYPCLINASRSILYAASERDFAQRAGMAARQLGEAIRVFHHWV